MADEITSTSLATKTKEAKTLPTKEEIEFAKNDPTIKGNTSKIWQLPPDEFEKKFIKGLEGQEVNDKVLTEEQAKNVWEAMSEESKAEYYYGHLDAAGDNFITDDLKKNSTTGVGLQASAIASAAVKKAKEDNTDEASWFWQADDVPDTSEVLSGKVKAPPASEEQLEEEKKTILDEKLANAEQCWLLSRLPLNKEAQRSGRVYHLETVTPQTFLNSLYLPTGHENVYYNDSGERRLGTPNDVIGSINVKFLDDKTDSKNPQYRRLFNLVKIANGNTNPDKYDISVNFEGGNTATARNDVTCQVVFTLSSINNLSKVLYPAESGDTGLKLLDVVLRPEFSRNAKDGLSFGAYYKKQFSPNNNKVLLEISTTHSDSGFSYNNTIMLCMTEQTMEIGESNEVTFTLNYRGYSETFLNMPYMDVLGGVGALINRNAREEQIIAAINKDCNSATIDKLKEQYRFMAKQDVSKSKSRIITTMLNNGLVYYTKADTESLKKIFEGGRIKSGTTGRITGGENFNSFKRIKNIKDKGYTDAIKETESTERLIKFVYLSDFLASLSDLFFSSDATTGQFTYDTRTTKSSFNSFFTNMQVKFVTLPIIFKSSGEDKNINLGDIPIAVSFIEKFLDEKYFSKNIEYATVLTFVRSFIENAIAKMIDKVCFVDEPFGGQIRTMVVRSTINDLLHKLTNTDLLEISLNTNVFSFPTASTLDSEVVNYIIIYASSQNNNERMLSEVVGDNNAVTMKDKNISKTIPVVVLSEANTTLPAFTGKYSKNDDPNLRAARYYSYQNDAFSAIGNVYDLALTTNKPILWFFPGNIFAIDIEGIDKATLNWKDKSFLGNKLGLTGFFIAYKVAISYNALGAADAFSVSIDTKFLDSIGGALKGSAPTVSSVEGDTDDCKGYVNTAATAISSGNPISGTALPAAAGNEKTEAVEETKGQNNTTEDVQQPVQNTPPVPETDAAKKKREAEEEENDLDKALE
jgi:hypothetical protein